jgi:predicted nucleic acid-binding protein
LKQKAVPGNSFLIEHFRKGTVQDSFIDVTRYYHIAFSFVVLMELLSGAYETDRSSQSNAVVCRNIMLTLHYPINQLDFKPYLYYARGINKEGYRAVFQRIKRPGNDLHAGDSLKNLYTSLRNASDVDTKIGLHYALSSAWLSR